MREWKSGDVVLVHWNDSNADEVGIVNGTSAGGGMVGVLCGKDRTLPKAFGAAEVRPLVVIDPEDRAQVERLLIAFLRDYDAMDSRPQPEETTSMQAALRSLVTPPKPDEPTGRWAVVEGRDGHHWVRDEASSRLPWRHVGPVDRSTSWEGIVGPYEPVKILSDGVQA